MHNIMCHKIKNLDNLINNAQLPPHKIIETL